MHDTDEQTSVLWQFRNAVLIVIICGTAEKDSEAGVIIEFFISLMQFLYVKLLAATTGKSNQSQNGFNFLYLIEYEGQ